MARLWFDVEDLFEYARANPRPSGIQRVAYELYRTAQEQYGAEGRIHFVRHDTARNTFTSVPWSEIEGLFGALAVQERPPPALAAMMQTKPRPAVLRSLRTLLHRLPVPLRIEILQATRLQIDAWVLWGRIVRNIFVRLIRGRRRQAHAGPGAAPARSSPGGQDDFEAMAAPGDMLLVLGAPWSHPDYAGLIRTQRARHGLRFALLVYDLIPIRRPEWCDAGLVRLFRAWFESVLPMSDMIFAISQSTAEDVARYGQERGIALPTVQSVPMGTTFGTERTAARRTPRLPPPRSYALFVSTIEARKNHLLLFRVWQRLLAEMPPGEVPDLVFAGRIGWMVQDLLQQIVNTEHLDGRLVIVEGPTDAELAALYEDCLFTVFPSFYEGWGLPVTESLTFGKPCVIADRTALPEAGGTLARCFDPDNLHDACAVIRSVIEDHEGLARWEARIKREFRPVPWSTSVNTLLAGLGDMPEDAVRACGAPAETR